MPIRKGTIITDGEKAIKMIKKLSSTAIAFIFTLTELSAAASFNGYGGLKGDLKSKEDSEFFDPIMNLTGFFQGQFNFSENLFFNTEMSISTDDVIDTKLTEDTRAVFCFDELSLTYVKNFLGATQFFSIFKGTYTPLGANQFAAIWNFASQQFYYRQFLRQQVRFSIFNKRFRTFVFNQAELKSNGFCRIFLQKQRQSRRLKTVQPRFSFCNRTQIPYTGRFGRNRSSFKKQRQKR